jgi:hypothetical protein
MHTSLEATKKFLSLSYTETFFVAVLYAIFSNFIFHWFISKTWHYLIILENMSTNSTSSSTSDLTSSESSCASGGSGVESKQLQYQQPAPAPIDPTATQTMSNYDYTYQVDASGQTNRVYGNR